MAFLPYGHQSISDEDIEAVVSVLRGDWLSQGPSVEEFEKTVAQYLDVKNAISFSNGTAALHGAMHVAGVKAGESILTTPMTFAATSNAALYCGGTPLFADIDPKTLCLDPESAAKVLCERDVRVIAPVSFAGYPVDLTPFKEMAEKNGAVLIEDGCHALGGERGDKKIGCEADMTIFSFHPVKHITTCEGGMVVTNNSDYAQALRRFRSHGIVKDPSLFTRPYAGGWDADMQELGYNYRLTDVASALGTSQMKRLDEFIVKRREIASLYRELLRDVQGLNLPAHHAGHAYHLFVVRVDASIRRAFFDELRAAGLGVQVHYVPVHLNTYYRDKFGYKPGDFPQAEQYSSEGLSLPIFPDMQREDVIRVVNTVENALHRLR